MSEPPRDFLEFLVRFVCAFVVFGIILALVALEYISDHDLLTVGVGWLVANVAVSLYASRHGDDAWHSFFESRWWPWW